MNKGNLLKNFQKTSLFPVLKEHLQQQKFALVWFGYNKKVDKKFNLNLNSSDFLYHDYAIDEKSYLFYSIGKEAPYTRVYLVTENIVLPIDYLERIQIAMVNVDNFEKKILHPSSYQWGKDSNSFYMQVHTRYKDEDGLSLRLCLCFYVENKTNSIISIVFSLNGKETLRLNTYVDICKFLKGYPFGMRREKDLILVRLNGKTKNTF